MDTYIILDTLGYEPTKLYRISPQMQVHIGSMFKGRYTSDDDIEELFETLAGQEEVDFDGIHLGYFHRIIVEM